MRIDELVQKDELHQELYAKTVAACSVPGLLYALAVQSKGEWFDADDVVGPRLEDIYERESYFPNFDVNRRRQNNVVQFQVEMRRTDSSDKV